MWLQFTGIVLINFQFAARFFCGITFYHRHVFILLWCGLGSVEHGRAGCLECDKGYTSRYAMLKISALSEVRASWRLHGGVRQV
ncbi:hypothetical protein C9000_12910 [Escherichia coli]|nr:hypothetical protein [Escherichia coli]EFB3581625.1 hypothetical protein [Escherichia coli]EFN4512173.1 hypothetical protein [Escherichia coli]TJD68314.1 hypothetical protein C9236_01720 [Escherichia coli]TJD98560.1 hypothetical protein C9235_01720 [Escherichia coli]